MIKFKLGPLATEWVSGCRRANLAKIMDTAGLVRRIIILDLPMTPLDNSKGYPRKILLSFF